MSVAFLASTVVAYGVFVAVIGQPFTLVDPGSSEARDVLVPTPGGWLFAMSGLSVIAGLATGHRLWIVGGATVVALFAILFLFGIGAPMLPVAAALASGVALLMLSTH